MLSRSDEMFLEFCQGGEWTLHSSSLYILAIMRWYLHLTFVSFGGTHFCASKATVGLVAEHTSLFVIFPIILDAIRPSTPFQGTNSYVSIAICSPSTITSTALLAIGYFDACRLDCAKSELQLFRLAILFVELVLLLLHWTDARSRSG